MTNGFGFDASTIALMVGGAIGALIHALSAKDNLCLLRSDWRLWGVRTFVDVTEGVALGMVFPVLETFLNFLNVKISLPMNVPALTPAHKLGIMVFVSWPLVMLIRHRVLDRFYPPPRTRRAADR